MVIFLIRSVHVFITEPYGYRAEPFIYYPLSTVGARYILNRYSHIASFPSKRKRSTPYNRNAPKTPLALAPLI